MALPGDRSIALHQLQELGFGQIVLFNHDRAPTRRLTVASQLSRALVCEPAERRLMRTADHFSHYVHVRCG